MLSSKKISQIVGCLFILLIAGCQHMPNNDYAFRQKCLNTAIDQCKAGGWTYATENPVCERVAAEGIYSLTASLLQSCREAEQSPKNRIHPTSPS
jgi:hypothetical protein